MLNKFLHQLFSFLKSYFVVIFLFFIFLASSYSVLHESFFRGHDFTHASRIAEMSRALDEGQFPVRWSGNFGYGFGMPLFNFYAPLPYFIGAIFCKLGCSVVTSIKILYLLVNAITLLGAYFLGRKLLGRWGGLLLAAAYTLAPYRSVNLFVREALSETFAMAFLPLVLFAIIAFTKEQRKKYLFILFISLFAILLSHNLTALIFIPLAAVFTFIYLLHQKKMKLLWPLAAQFLLAGAASAFYVVPALLEKDLTVINTIFSGYFHYSNHFLYIRQFFQDRWQYEGSVWGPDDGISFFLGKGQLLGLLCLGLFCAFHLYKNFKKFRKSHLFFLILLFGFFTLFALFMSLMKSQFIWDNLAILQFIQFPWRFLSVAVFFIAILLAISAYLIKNRQQRGLYGLFILFVLLFNATYFKPEKYLDEQDALYYTDAKRIQNEMSAILPDYIPKQMAEQTILLKSNQELPAVWLASGQEIDKLETIVDHSFEKLISLELREAELVNFKVANFAGWQAEIDGQKQDIQTNSSLGNIQISVPAGHHQVGIYLSENTTARKIGDSLSLVALFITVFYFFYPFAKNQNLQKVKAIKRKR